MHFGSGQQVGSKGRAGPGWAGSHQQAGLSEPILPFTQKKKTSILPDPDRARLKAQQSGSWRLAANFQVFLTMEFLQFVSLFVKEEEPKREKLGINLTAVESPGLTRRE